MEPYNQHTIFENGEGQVIGRYAEQEFANWLVANRMVFTYSGPDKGSVDFDVNGFTIDVKCKQRNVEAQLDHDAHVNWYQKKFAVQIYVFCSYWKQAEQLQWMGWIGKKEFWKQARRVEAGQLDGTFQEKKDSGKLKYSELRPMPELIECLEGIT